MIITTTLAIVIIVLSLLFLILFIANAWYWSRIYYGTDLPANASITKSEAGWLFGFNVIWAIVALGLLIYGIVLIIGLQKTTKTTAIPTVIAERKTTTISSTTPATVPLPLPVPVQVPVVSHTTYSEPRPLYTMA